MGEQNVCRGYVGDNLTSILTRCVSKQHKKAVCSSVSKKEQYFKMQSFCVEYGKVLAACHCFNCVFEVYNAAR